MQRKLQPYALIGSLFIFSIFALAIAGGSATTLAQDDPGPTPTPTTPVWLAFSALRDAVEEEHGVNLSLVRRYDWQQEEYPVSIDTCKTLDDPNAARPVYFGWTFTITDLANRVYQGRVSFDLKAVVVCDEVTTAAVEADTASGDLPAPVAGSAAGGSFELGGHALEMSLGTFDLMRRSGMNWVKQQYEYHLGDDPSAVAAQIDVAHSTGFKILLSIPGDPAQMGDFNGYVNSYSQFLAGVAGLGADAIEVWNEPNIDREWPADRINGGNYTQMLAAAFNAIKTSNPNTLVISAAPAPTGFFGAAGCGAGGCNDDIFMQQMADAGAAQFMDCVGLHYNEGIVPPSQVGGDPRGEFPTYYFGSMLARGVNPFGKQACFTELGYLSNEGYAEPLPGAFGWAANTTVGQQAAWMAEAASIAAQSGQVRLMIVWNVDFPQLNPADPMHGYALFRPDQSCPACDSLGAVMGIQ